MFKALGHCFSYAHESSRTTAGCFAYLLEIVFALSVFTATSFVHVVVCIAGAESCRVARPARPVAGLFVRGQVVQTPKYGFTLVDVLASFQALVVRFPCADKS